MIDANEIRSITEFQRNLKDYVVRLKQSKSAMLLTVNGRAEIVVQDAAGYQEMLERLERAEAIAGIRDGMEQAADGQSLSVDEAESRLRMKHGFSR